MRTDELYYDLHVLSDSEGINETVTGQIDYYMEQDGSIHAIEYKPIEWDRYLDKFCTSAEQDVFAGLFAHQLKRNPRFEQEILDLIIAHEKGIAEAAGERHAINQDENEQEDRMLAMGGVGC